MAFVIPVGRMSFPNVFEPKKNNLNGKMEYSYDHLFEPGQDLSALEAALETVAVKKFGPREDWPAKLHWPIKDQGERVLKVDGKIVKDEKGKPKLRPGYVKGAKYMTLKSDKQPGVVDQLVQPIVANSNKIYAGVYVQSSVGIFAFDKAGSCGVQAGLNNIQKVKDGPVLAGRTKAEDDFTALAPAPEDLDNLIDAA